MQYFSDFIAERSLLEVGEDYSLSCNMGNNQQIKWLITNYTNAAILQIPISTCNKPTGCTKDISPRSFKFNVSLEDDYATLYFKADINLHELQCKAGSKVIETWRFEYFSKFLFNIILFILFEKL